jgi:hypothetical protein
LVVIAKVNGKNDARDIFELVDEFLPVRTLVADAKHMDMDSQRTHAELAFLDAGCSHPGHKYVGLGWNVVFLSDPENFLDKAVL